MNKILIVDDNDPSIQYAGKWILKQGDMVESPPREHLDTAHWSSVGGDSLSYAFEGVSIAIYGTVNGTTNSLAQITGTLSINSGTSSVVNATVNVALQTYTSLVTHVLLYQSPNLPKGNYKLSLSVNSGSAPWRIDYLTVDTNSIRVGTFSTSANVPVSVFLNYTDLMSFSETPLLLLDDSGTIFAKFNGTEITAYGSAPPYPISEQIQIGFMIDGVSRLNYSTIPSYAGLAYAPSFHARGLDALKEHTLGITPFTNHLWGVDYVVYTTSDSAGSEAGTPPVFGSSGGESRGGTTTGSNKTGIIAGGIVVGIVGLLAIAVVGLFLIKRRRRKLEAYLEQLEGDSGISQAHIEPFLVFVTGPTNAKNGGTRGARRMANGRGDGISAQTTVGSTFASDQGELDTATTSSRSAIDQSPAPTDRRQGSLPAQISEWALFPPSTTNLSSSSLVNSRRNSEEKEQGVPGGGSGSARARASIRKMLKCLDVSSRCLNRLGRPAETI